MEKEIILKLEDHEILILRGQMRMLQILSPEEDEISWNYINKILNATNEQVSPEARKEIGKIQRAARRIRESPFYPQMMHMLMQFQNLLVTEMQKEE